MDERLTRIVELVSRIEIACRIRRTVDDDQMVLDLADSAISKLSLLCNRVSIGNSLVPPPSPSSSSSSSSSPSFTSSSSSSSSFSSLSPLDYRNPKYLVAPQAIYHPLSNAAEQQQQQQECILTEATLNRTDSPDGVDLIKVAYTAFQMENFAKCVRTIERIASLQHGKLPWNLINLCHKSYKKVIDCAPTINDRLKLCDWWRIFIENTDELVDSTGTGPSTKDGLLRQIDLRNECLNEKLKLSRSVGDRMKAFEQLIVGLIEAYEVDAQGTRDAPRSVAKLKSRIVALSTVIYDFLTNFEGLGQVPLFVEEGVELLRYVYGETRDELSKYAEANNIQQIDGMIEISQNVELVLRQCGWCSPLPPKVEVALNSRTSSISEQSMSDSTDQSNSGPRIYDDHF